MRDISRAIRAVAEEIPIPTIAQIRLKQDEKSLQRVREALGNEIPMEFQTMVGKLMAEGHEPAMIASAAMQLCFQRDEEGLVDIEFDRKTDGGRLYRKLLLNIGRRQKVAPNHIVSAIAGAANIRGSEIGKIEIYDERTVVGVPAERAEAIERAMQGATICGQTVLARLSSEKAATRPAPQARGGRRPEGYQNRRERKDFSGGSARFAARRADRAGTSDGYQRRGKVKLSPEARSRLLDTTDLSRFEFRADNREDRSRHQKPDSRRNERRGNRRTGVRGPVRRGRK